MPSTYTGDPSFSPKDTLRFYLQDTTAPMLLTDGEIEFAYTLQGNSIARTLEALINTLIARFAGKPQEESLEGLSVTYGDIASKYRALKADYASMASQGKLPEFGETVPSTDLAYPTFVIDDESPWSHLR